MANTTENIYIKMNIDTKAFDGSMTGIKREMASLRGLVGNSMLSPQDNAALTKRLGELKNRLDDVKIAANNIDTGDVFGNTARFAGVAANAVAGVTGAMSLLGLESEKAGEVEKKILQFMAIGNALQSVADAKRLGALAAIYGQRLKDFVLGKEILAQETKIAAANVTGNATGGEPVKIVDTSAVANTNAAANIAQAGSLSSVATSMEATNAASLELAIAQERLTLLDKKAIAETWKEIAAEQEANAVRYKSIGATNKLMAAKIKLAEANTEATFANEAYAASLKRLTVLEAQQAATTEGGTAATSTNTVATETNTVAKNANTKGTIISTFANFGFIAGVKAMTKAVWEFTVSLLANPIVWFAVALAAVAAAIYAVVQALTAESRALKTNNEALKEHNKYLKEMQDEMRNVLNENDALTDRLLVNAGKLSESDAKRKENGRQFNVDMIALNEKLVKELERINKDYDDGKIVGTRMRDDLLKSAQEQFNKNAVALATNFNLKQEQITSDADKAATDKAIEAQKERAQKLKDQREKEFDDLVKEVQDYTNQLLALQDAQYAERNAAEQRNLDYNKNKLKEQLAEKLITQTEYNRKVRQLELDFLVKQRDELKRQYDTFIGSEADKIKLKTLLGNKEQEVNNKISENYVANKEEEAAALVEFNNLFKEVEDEQIKIRLENIEKAKQAAADAEAKRRELFNGIFTDWDKLNPEEQVQGIAQAAQFALESYAQISDAIIARNLQALAVMTEEQLAAVGTQFEQQMQVLDKAVEEGIITQEYYNKMKEEADAKRLAKEKALKTAQAEQEKRYSITQAIIGTALAVLNGLQTKPFPVGLIMAGVAAVAGAIQINTIKSAPLPTFGLGGPIKGNSHVQGGVPITAEGGEYIINKNVAQKPGMGSFLNKVNSGQISSTTYNNGVDMDVMRQIITEAVTSVSSIPVLNVESDFTRVQRRVSNIETKAKWVILILIYVLPTLI